MSSFLTTMRRVRASLVAGLATDMFPAAEPWLGWLRRPAAVLGCGLAAALACGVFLHPVALVAAAALALVLAIGFAWPTIAVRGLSAELRFFESRVREGDMVHAAVAITNAWPWPIWGISIAVDLGRQESVSLAAVAGLSTAEFEWTLVAGRRGEYPAAAPLLTTGFPFGLRHARHPVTVGRTLLVWPQSVPLETLLDAAETRPADDRFSAVRVGESGDNGGTRPFRAGDSLRRVHWPQTARHGGLVVCERQAPAFSAVRVVFDPEPWLHEDVGGENTFEPTLRIVASICAAYHREQAVVECCHGHRTMRVTHGPAGLRRFFDALARLQPQSPVAPGQSDDDPAAGHACRRIHHRDCGTFQITVTTSRGEQGRIEHRHVHGDELRIVLDTGGTPAPAGQSARRTVRVPVSPRGLDRFRQLWKELCRAG